MKITVGIEAPITREQATAIAAATRRHLQALVDAAMRNGALPPPAPRTLAHAASEGIVEEVAHVQS